MKTIFVYDEPSEQAFTRWLAHYLKTYQSVGMISPQELLIPPTDFHFLLIEQNSLQKISAECLLVCLGATCRQTSLAEIPPNALMIANSENQLHRTLLSSFRGTVISFGRSQTDTVTFSSCSEDRAVVCLQRTILALDGTTIEPMEIPCRKPVGLPDDSLLGFVTALLAINQLHISPQGESLDFVKWMQ